MSTPSPDRDTRILKIVGIIATLLAVVVGVVALTVVSPKPACAALTGVKSLAADIPSCLPSMGGEPVRLAVVGDVGTGDANEQAIADLVARTEDQHEYEGLVLLGDNVYPAGDPDRLDATVFGPFSSVLDDGTTLLPVLGNHDVMDGNANGQVEAMDMPGRWYATTIGPALLVGLDSNLVQSQAQTEWLESTLAAAEAPWLIVAMHHPAYSVGVHGSTAEILERWVPLFERYDVDLVLAGHDHDYQRTMPINGVTYVVSGGGGAEVRPTGDGDYIEMAISVRHFVDLAIWSDRIELTAIDLVGPFDHLTFETTSQS